jgi:hypothetical protein
LARQDLGEQRGEIQEKFRGVRAAVPSNRRRLANGWPLLVIPELDDPERRSLIRDRNKS